MSLYSIKLNLEWDEAARVYVVTSPDVPELITEGAAPEEIIRNVQDAIDVMIDVYQREGWELPPALRSQNALRPESVQNVLVAV